MHRRPGLGINQTRSQSWQQVGTTHMKNEKAPFLHVPAHDYLGTVCVRQLRSSVRQYEKDPAFFRRAKLHTRNSSRQPTPSIQAKVIRVLSGCVPCVWRLETGVRDACPEWMWRNFGAIPGCKNLWVFLHASSMVEEANATRAPPSVAFLSMACKCQHRSSSQQKRQDQQRTS